MRTWLGWSLLATIALSGACGGGGDANPSATPTRDPGDTTEIEISAVGNTFDVDLIRVDGGDHVKIVFTNEDAAPHNIAIYETPAAEVEIFVGDTFSGPGETRTYEFDAPERNGTYFFRCDVHPTQMIGDFIVR